MFVHNNFTRYCAKKQKIKENEVELTEKSKGSMIRIIVLHLGGMIRSTKNTEEKCYV